MDKTVFWSQDADFDKEFKGGMYVRSDLGKSFAKWKDNVKIVGIAIDDSNSSLMKTRVAERPHLVIKF